MDIGSVGVGDDATMQPISQLLPAICGVFWGLGLAGFCWGVGFFFFFFWLAF